MITVNVVMVVVVNDFYTWYMAGLHFILSDELHSRIAIVTDLNSDLIFLRARAK
jgi:hypothetical protein